MAATGFEFLMIPATTMGNVHPTMRRSNMSNGLWPTLHVLHLAPYYSANALAGKDGK